MKDQSKTKQALIQELDSLRRRIAELEQSESERKRAEEALHRAEENFRRSLDDSPLGIRIVNAEGETIYANRAILDIYSLEDLNTTPVKKRYTPESFAEYKIRREKRKRGDYVPAEYEISIVRKDGEIRNLQVFRKEILWDGEKQFQVIYHDITERKRAEDARKQAEEKYRNIFENILEGIYRTTPAGRFVILNPAFARICGYASPEEMMEKVTDIANQLYANPEDRLRFRKLIVAEGQVKGFDVQFKHPTKGLVWVSIQSNPIRDEQGNILYYDGTIEDITERKQAEEERKVLQERLQRSEKMEALGNLAGGVAHDLNNVLGLVVGYAELLLMDADESSSIRPQLVNIMNGGLKAAAIVADLLTLARRGVPGRKVLNLNWIIADSQQLPEFEKLSSHHSSVRIRTDLEPDLVNISGSSVHLGKTLFNLVSNASESMTKGGIVTIKTANQYLEKPIQGYDEVREGDYVVLSVSDTGEGIPAADLKRIFEPFYTKKVMGRSGTGLGLAVVWGTVKDHHGYINVESEEGKGSIFTLYFPVTREDISAEASAISISEYMGSGESILIVDDVKGQRDLAATMLQKLNYNVASVSSGEEAIEYLKEHKIDLMVLDMIMDPGMDGLDTYKKVLEIHPGQKAIIVSGFSESDRVITAQTLGAGAYVRKPYVIEKLGLAVRKELDRK